MHNAYCIAIAKCPATLRFPLLHERPSRTRESHRHDGGCGRPEYFVALPLGQHRALYGEVRVPIAPCPLAERTRSISKLCINICVYLVHIHKHSPRDGEARSCSRGVCARSISKVCEYNICMYNIYTHTHTPSWWRGAIMLSRNARAIRI